MINYDYLQEEYAKCFLDKSRIYMIQNYLKTYDATQRKMVQFNLFPRQQDLCTTMGNANNVVTTKPRQAGITTTAGAFISCEMCLADPESPQVVLVIGNTLDLAQQMVTKIREFLLQFPRWMWGDEYIKSNPKEYNEAPTKEEIFKICNQKELVLKNGCRVVARSSGPDASRGVGGVTWLIFDEAAFIENGNDVYASAIPTVSTGGHVIMISTPNGKDLLYYETCRQAKLKGTDEWNNFELVEMKWYQDPRYNKFLEWYRKDKETGEVTIKKEPTINKLGDIRYDNKHWENMISDGWKPRSPWYIKMCQQFNNDTQKIAQELDVSFLGSASNVVEPEYIEMQEQLNQREPMGREENGDMFHLDETWVWKLPIPGHRYLMCCLPSGEKVLTENGLLNIEDVGLNDKLIGKNGDPVQILNLHKHYVCNENVYKIKISNFIRETTFTGNHPIWASTKNTLKRCYEKNNKNYNFNERYWNHCFEFTKSENLKPGDWIEIPNMYYGKTLSKSEILSKWEKYFNITRSDFKIDCPLFDNDFWWYVGMWLAEGYVDKTALCTCHNINEKKYTEKISNLFKKYNRKVNIVENEQHNSMVAKVSSKQVSNFIIDEFGKYSFGKKIPEWVKYLPHEFKLSIIDGYFSGDGCLTKNKNGLTASCVSVSLNLIEGIQDILLSIGIISSVKLKKKYYNEICGKKIKTLRDKYELTLGLYDTLKLCKLLKYDTFGYDISNRRIIKDSYFSKDFKKIYFKIKKIEVTEYTGYVYNFETETHTFCCKNIVTHNCDPSRGDSEDRSALEIIDLDGIDDDGTPCIEQVLEYNGKITGDDLGEIAYWYGNMYGEAFAVVECIGGYGDSTVLSLMRLGYKNLYYDDPNLKTFTIAREASSLQLTNDGKLPGFHTSQSRFQMLSHFANMIRTNEFKVRSKRVIGELDTWVFKNGKQDHQDGCHDDTLTCLAMGMFVYKFHMGDIQRAKERDAAFLRAWINSANSMKFNITAKTPTEVSIEPVKSPMPFYTQKTLQKSSGNPLIDAYRWLIY